MRGCRPGEAGPVYRAPLAAPDRGAATQPLASLAATAGGLDHLVLSALVIAVLGFFLVQSIAAGLLSSAEKSRDRAQVQNGANFAFDQASGSTGSYLVFVQLTDGGPVGAQWAAQRNVNITATIPPGLIADVGREQGQHRSDNDYTATPWSEPTTLTYSPGYGTSPARRWPSASRSAPTTSCTTCSRSPSSSPSCAGPADPGRRRARAGRAAGRDRLAGHPVGGAARPARGPGGPAAVGRHLEERMQVLGVDDLAALATSFNEMAASLQAKLRELEELSRCSGSSSRTCRTSCALR
jgi:hypothetical protein